MQALPQAEKEVDVNTEVVANTHSKVLGSAVHLMSATTLSASRKDMAWSTDALLDRG